MTQMRIDIVSDVVCPWCVIGFKRLEQALAQLDAELVVAVLWHPFELNPEMPPGGQDLREHVAQKYGASDEQSAVARTRLTALAADLGVDFRYDDQSRIYNTFKAHQLLHWALRSGRQAPLKFALFDAYFTRQEAVDEDDVLVAAAERAGLDADEARALLADGRFAEDVRNEERFWVEKGIAGVPAFVIDGRYLVSGAQEPAVLVDVIERAVREPAA